MTVWGARRRLNAMWRAELKHQRRIAWEKYGEANTAFNQFAIYARAHAALAEDAAKVGEQVGEIVKAEEELKIARARL